MGFWQGVYAGLGIGIPAGVLACVVLILIFARWSEGREYLPGPFGRKK